MEVVAPVMVLAIVFAIIWAIEKSARGTRHARLRELADGFLDNVTFDNAATNLRGQRQGVAARFHLTGRGGKHKTPWTEIDAEIPPNYPLSLWLTRHRDSDRSDLTSGEMVDVKLDVPEFDAEFLVEGAPADVVRRLLDESTRAYLLAHPAIELATKTDGGKPVLRLAVRGRFETLDDQRRAIDIPVRLVQRLREVYSEADAAIAPEVVGDAYRPVLDDSRREQAARDREHEVRTIEDVRGKRTERDRRNAIWIAVLIIGGVFLLNILLAASK